MAINNKVIISLLAVATIGVTNSSIQADMIVFPGSQEAPTYEVSVEIDKGQVGEARNVVDETTVETQQTEETSLVASALEREADATDPLPTEIPETEATEPEITEPVVIEVPVETTVEPTIVPTPAPVVINYPAQGTVELELFLLVNAEREANGLQPYSYRTDLASAASIRAAEIVDFFSHTRPDGTPYYTVNENIVYGENLAEGYATAQEVFAGWMASPTHKALILDDDYTACGFALHVNGDGVHDYYWAQEFGYTD